MSYFYYKINSLQVNNSMCDDNQFDKAFLKSIHHHLFNY